MLSTLHTDSCQQEFIASKYIFVDEIPSVLVKGFRSSPQMFKLPKKIKNK